MSGPEGYTTMMLTAPMLRAWHKQGVPMAREHWQPWSEITAARTLNKAHQQAATHLHQKLRVL